MRASAGSVALNGSNSHILAGNHLGRVSSILDPTSFRTLSPDIGRQLGELHQCVSRAARAYMGGDALGFVDIRKFHLDGWREVEKLDLLPPDFEVRVSGLAFMHQSNFPVVLTGLGFRI